MRLSMPPSVRFAVLALGLAAGVLSGLLVAWALGRDPGWLHGLAGSGILGVILLGLVRASRLAWLWARILGYALAAVLLAALILRVHMGDVEPLPAALLVMGVALPLAAHSLALGRPAAFEWFGLVCPRCGATTGRSDLFMWAARCERCGAAF